MNTFFFALGAGVVLVACEPTPGPIPDQNPTPSGGGVSQGVVLVDPRTENVFVWQYGYGNAPPVDAALASAPDASCSTFVDAGSDAPDESAPDAADADVVITNQVIEGIDPDTGAVRTVAQFASGDEVTLLFPPAGLLFVDETAASQFADAELRLVDPSDGTVLARQAIPGLGWLFLAVDAYDRISPQLSANGAYATILGADNVLTASMSYERQLIVNTSTLATHAVPCGSSGPTWMNSGDEFIILSGAESGVRVREWSASALESQGYPIASDGFWAGATTDFVIAGLDVGFFVNDIIVSPDDTRVAIVEGIGRLNDEGVVIIDLTNRTSVYTPHMTGTPAFTPDSSTLVALVDTTGEPDAGVPDTGVPDAGGDPQLALIDVTTGDVMSYVALPAAGDVQFFPTRDGNMVFAFALSESDAPSQLGLVDVATHAYTRLGTNANGYGVPPFVSRVGHDEIWYLAGGLTRVDLTTQTLRTFPLTFAPDALGILPMHDLLVMGESGTTAVDFWSPESDRLRRHVDY